MVVGRLRNGGIIVLRVHVKLSILRALKVRILLLAERERAYECASHHVVFELGV